VQKVGFLKYKSGILQGCKIKKETITIHHSGRQYRRERGMNTSVTE